MVLGIDAISRLQFTLELGRTRIIILRRVRTVGTLILLLQAEHGLLRLLTRDVLPWNADLQACNRASILAGAERLLAAEASLVVEALLLVAAILHLLARPDIILSVRPRILNHRALILLRPKRNLRVVVDHIVGVRYPSLCKQLDLAVFALLS